MKEKIWSLVSQNEPSLVPINMVAIKNFCMCFFFFFCLFP